MKYLNYTAADFATDEHFIEWVQCPTEEADAVWAAFLLEHPWQQAAIKEAREMVLYLSDDLHPAADEAIEEVWEQLLIARQQYSAFGERLGRDRDVTSSARNRVVFLWAAAAAALLLVSGFLLYQQRENPLTYATAAGERMHLRLPDSSYVVLNSDSRLMLPASWSKDKPRVVQLEGQAFFSVTHQHNNQKFIVETADGLEVEVRGTEFSVNSKGPLQQVVLESGAVNVAIKTERGVMEVGMAPGELVEVSGIGNFTKKKVQPQVYTAWKSASLVLENKTLGEVAELLRHSYGYAVVLADTSLSDQRITAYLDHNTADHILSTLSETLEVKIQKDSKNITISSN